MLTVRGPGMLGFRLQRPEGLPDVDTPRTGMVRYLGDAPGAAKLAALDPEERDSLFLSLALTLGRARYHRQRFQQVIDALNRRREEVAGFITFDLFSQYTIYEASGLLGAVRLGIDEILFITARLRNVDPADIDAHWKAETVLRADFDKRPDFNLPEVAALRTRLDWYDELKDYRNVLFHRGWRPQYSGYFPIGSSLPEARDHRHNVMLVPDRASLKNRARPHKWTYTEGKRLEDVVERAAQGFDDLLDDMCMNVWEGSAPPEGLMPKDRHPNLLMSLVRPVLLTFKKQAILPVFTSSELAHAFNGFPSHQGLDLAEMLPSSKVMPDRPGFVFALPGLKDAPDLPPPESNLNVVLDPVFDIPSQTMLGRGHFAVPLATLLAADESDPLNIPQSEVGGAARLYMWRHVPGS